MYSCFGLGSSPGRLNSISSGRPPGIQKILSGYPVLPGVASFEPMIPRCFHANSQACCSILDSTSLINYGLASQRFPDNARIALGPC